MLIHQKVPAVGGLRDRAEGRDSSEVILHKVLVEPGDMRPQRLIVRGMDTDSRNEFFSCRRPRQQRYVEELPSDVMVRRHPKGRQNCSKDCSNDRGH